MDTLLKIIEKLEAPLFFARWDSYSRLPLIINLDSTMTSLLEQLWKEITHKKLVQLEEIEGQIRKILALFSDYSGLTPEEKKERLDLASTRLAELKNVLLKAERGYEAKKKGGEGGLRSQDSLYCPIRSLTGIGPRTAALLTRKNLQTVEDLLYFLPRRYEDRRNISMIAEAVPGMRQMVVGKVVQADMRFYGRKRVFEAIIEDSSGIIKAKWFKGRELFLRNTFKPEARVILAGEILGFPFEREIVHPDFEVLNDSEDQLLHFKRIVPVYSETEGLSQKTIRRIMWKTVRDFAPYMQSPIPEGICKKRSLMDFSEAIRLVHFPDNNQNIDLYQQMRSEAHKRLIYEELFFLQLGMALRKKGRLLESGISFNIDHEILNKFFNMLPFSITAAQRRVINEIHGDMASILPMNRLLQGDVGSGKTVVATSAMVFACANGYQAAIMAPTEILAEQHFRNISNLTQSLGIKCELLTGNLKTAEKKEALERIEKGQTQLMVGTHALIQEKVVFSKLGLVVIDEQHRFGVVQRATLRKKGQIPDVLIMTATPIPRTLAMTAYGDLDVSVIDELPPGKIAPRTKVYPESQRARVYEIIHREVVKGNQVFIVYPLVETSESLDLKDAVRMAEHLQKDVFPDLKIGLVHGRMKGKAKEQVMNEFVEMKINILVATTVIEVGIDIPAASLMVIEHAERFGLSQLHQLRGRVGRGEAPSYCILLVQKTASEDSRKRLRIMEQTNDGFRIAEEDLAIRGPGEFLGTRQSGLPDFRVANLARDGLILSEAKNDAFSVINDDPRLGNPGNVELKDVLMRRWKGRLELAKTG